MKTNSFLMLACAGLLAATACSNDNQGTAADTGTTSSMAGDAADSPTDNSATTVAEANTGTTALNGYTPDDKQFMVKADQGGHNEIELSKLALEKGVTGDAKTFANKMITDHTKAGNELKPIAQKNNVTLTGEMDAQHKVLYDTMSKMSGQQFEQAYMDQMVKDHQQTVTLLQGEIEGGEDPEVKAWAQKTLPVVEQHTTMAQHNEGMDM